MRPFTVEVLSHRCESMLETNLIYLGTDQEGFYLYVLPHDYETTENWLLKTLNNQVMGYLAIHCQWCGEHLESSFINIPDGKILR